VGPLLRSVGENRTLDRAVKGLDLSAQELMEAFFELKIVQDIR
jgi:hypothetical protein